MSYEPDNRYSRSRAERNEIDTPFAEKALSDRGQFWNVDRHIRGRWTGVGASTGFFAALFATLLGAGWENSLADLGHGGSLAAYYGAGIVAGAAVGFLAANLRRRFTGED